MNEKMIHHQGDKNSKYDRLYKWQRIERDRFNEKDYLESEIDLSRYNIRTKVIKEGDTYSLYVPMKDAEVAQDYLESKVTAIFTNPHDDYHVFDKSLHYKNDAFYRERYPRDPRAVTMRRLSLILIALVAVLLLLKFKFS